MEAIGIRDDESAKAKRAELATLGRPTDARGGIPMSRLRWAFGHIALCAKQDAPCVVAGRKASARHASARPQSAGCGDPIRYYGSPASYES
jgi:hypothetical protein